MKNAYDNKKMKYLTHYFTLLVPHAQSLYYHFYLNLMAAQYHLLNIFDAIRNSGKCWASRRKSHEQPITRIHNTENDFHFHFKE